MVFFFNSKKVWENYDTYPRKKKKPSLDNSIEVLFKISKNLDFSRNRTYRINQLSFLLSGLLMLSLSDTERVLVSRTRVGPENNPEVERIDLLQIQSENTEHVSTLYENQTVRVLT